jgi:hypothetical protein
MDWGSGAYREYIYHGHEALHFSMVELGTHASNRRTTSLEGEQDTMPRLIEMII